MIIYMRAKMQLKIAIMVKKHKMTIFCLFEIFFTIRIYSLPNEVACSLQFNSIFLVEIR